MRNINIESNDIQSFKTVIEILSGIVSDVNVEIIKDKDAYKQARQGNTKTDTDNKKIKNNEDDEDNEDDQNSQDNQIDDEDEDNQNEDDNHSEDNDNNEDNEDEENEDLDSDNEDEENDDIDSDNDSEDPLPKKSSKVTKTKKTLKKSTKKIVKNKKKSKSKKNSSDDSNTIDSDDDIEKENNKKDNPGQIKILTSNEDNVMLIFMTLEGQHFSTFEVNGKTDNPNVSYTIGLDIEELNKFMKTVNKQGTLSIYQDTGMLDYICFNVTDLSIGTVDKFDLRRINIEKPPDKNIEVNVSMVVRMPCTLFHTACKNLQNFDPFVEFICDRDSLRIVCMGEQSNNERQFFDIRRLRKKQALEAKKDKKDKNIEDTDDNDDDYEGVKITLSKDIEKETLRAKRKAEEGSDYESEEEDEDDEAPEVISLLFDLRYINYMYKCQNLCDYVNIHLTPRGIMFLSYEIKMLGTLLVGIAPKNPENAQEEDDNDDKYYEDTKPIKMKRSLN